LVFSALYSIDALEVNLEGRAAGKGKGQKKIRLERRTKIHSDLSLVREAFAAINRTIFPGLEWDFAGLAARGTHSVEHFALRSAVAFTGIAAGLTSLRFIGESFFLEKVLFACCEHKILSAVFTCDSFVLMNQLEYLFNKIYARP
jgi:hypothetical protein